MANMFSNIDSTMGKIYLLEILINFSLPIVTMDLKHIVSVGIELSIFVNPMVLGHHKINPQLFDFQSLSLIGIQLFATDILRFYGMDIPVVHRTLVQCMTYRWK